MIANDDVVYVPFAFGYVNYAVEGRRTASALRRRADARHRRAPCSAARASASAPSRNIARRRSTMRVFLCSPDYQRGDYVTAGGQPGSLSAWKDDDRQRLLPRDFFTDPRSAPSSPPIFVRRMRASWPSSANAPRALRLPLPVKRRHPISPARSTASIAKPDRPTSYRGASPDEHAIVKAFEEGEEQGRNEYRAPAAEKALDILELMADQAEGLTQTEIANGLGRSIHEIYRILLLLENRGYIVRTRSDRFRLSLKLFELAHRHPPVNRLVECALPVMRELAANADQSCHLVVREGQNVLVVLQIDSPLADALFGCARLALPDAGNEFRRGSAGPSGPRRARPRSSSASLLPAKDRARARKSKRGSMRRRGSATRCAARWPSTACTNISTPVCDHTGAVIAALTVPVHSAEGRALRPETVFKRTSRRRRKNIGRARRRRNLRRRLTCRPGTAGESRSELNHMVTGRRT